MKPVREMKSCQSRFERIAALAWAVMHIIGLPLGAGVLYALGYMSETMANLVVYAAGLLFMLVTQWKFLRRDFDVLWEHPLTILWQVVGGYVGFMGMNMLIALLMELFIPAEANPNNQAVAGMLQSATGPAMAMAVFMAPVVEELIFRAGIFGSIRRHNRTAAYIVSILLFSLYHVVGFAFEDPRNLLYIVQYIPVSFLLAYVYERTDCIWTPIFLHMTVNYISTNLLTSLG